MLYFLFGLFVGGMAGYIACSLLSINHLSKRPNTHRGQHEVCFPLIDCDGIMVHADRRMQPDRRLRSSIQST